MNIRVWKILGWTAALLVVLGIGAAAGGGIVYAMTRAERSEVPQLVSAGPLDPEPGVVIASVVPDGPAEKAGVKRGDILLQVDDEPVDDAMDLVRALAEYEPGDEVELAVLHGDDERTLDATLGERDGRPYLGVVPCGAPVDVGRAVSVFEGGSGGGSDGNFTASIGAPTIDGMGAVGDGLHALHEQVLLSSLPEKVALAAAILQAWQD